LVRAPACDGKVVVVEDFSVVQGEVAVGQIGADHLGE
jgi:hypothetical protein